MKVNDHKQEIIETRKSGLGSSDAKMVLSVARNKKLNRTAKQRIAQMLDIIERPQFTNISMQYGNYIEDELHKFILLAHPNAISNPFREFKELSDRFDFSVFNHIDHEVETPTEIIWFETKAVNATLIQTLKTYHAQLQWHCLIGKALAKKKKKKFKLMIAYYHTDDKVSEFDADNIVLKEVKSDRIIIDEIIEGLVIIQNEIKDFEYEKEEVLIVDELPLNLQQELTAIVEFKRMSDNMSEREKLFKQRLFEVLDGSNIKSIQTPEITITKIEATTSMRFNSTKFKKDHPKLHKEYLTKNERKGYVTLKIKEEK